MDFVDKQLDSLKTLSRSIAITMAALASASIYVVQRDLRVIGGVLDAMGGQPQVQYSLLSFNYETMTFVWPFFLGGACVAVKLLIVKREAVLQELLGSTPAKTLIASDPWYFYLDVSSKILKVLGCLLLLLPGLAILLMLVGLFVAQDIGSITSAFQLPGIVFGLCCVPSLWQSIKILIAQKESVLLNEPSLQYVEAPKGNGLMQNSSTSRALRGEHFRNGALIFAISTAKAFSLLFGDLQTPFCIDTYRPTSSMNLVSATFRQSPSSQRF